MPELFQSETSDASGAGLGLRRAFIREVAENPPSDIDWYEISPENYIGRGGRSFDCLERIAAAKPLVAHGLSLSIGSLDELDWDYLKRLKAFLRRYRIVRFSDHLCFSSFDAHQFHDLLPLPFTREAVRHVAERARAVQDFLETPLSLENVSFYLHPVPPEMSETDFVLEVLERSGVGLMLDVNNAYVNALNHGTDARAFLAALPRDRVAQIHVAGHARISESLVVDTHGTPVCDGVWELLAWYGSLAPLPPVMIERDNDIPPLPELVAEVRRAADLIQASRETPLPQAAGGCR